MLYDSHQAKETEIQNWSLKKSLNIKRGYSLNWGKCPGRFAREELIEEQFLKLLGRIRIDDEVMQWMVSVMDAASGKDREEREAQQKALATQKSRLESGWRESIWIVSMGWLPRTSTCG